MRFPVAALMVGFGYAVIYWALMRVYAFGPSDGTAQLKDNHAVATMGVLLGLKNADTGLVTSPPVHINTPGYADTLNNTTGTNSPSGGQSI